MRYLKFQSVGWVEGGCAELVKLCVAQNGQQTFYVLETRLLEAKQTPLLTRTRRRFEQYGVDGCVAEQDVTRLVLCYYYC